MTSSEDTQRPFYPLGIYELNENKFLDSLDGIIQGHV